MAWRRFESWPLQFIHIAEKFNFGPNFSARWKIPHRVEIWRNLNLVRALNPICRSADAPCADGIQSADQIQISSNFYAIWKFPKRGEIWTKIEFLRDMENIQCTGFKPAPGFVSSFYHLAPWPLAHYVGIFIFFITFASRGVFLWFFTNRWGI